MADLFSKNKMITIKKHERDKLIALAQIHAREIRIMEIEEEIERCKFDIENQKKIIIECDVNIKQQELKE
jgi:hypothetical protein